MIENKLKKLANDMAIKLNDEQVIILIDEFSKKKDVFGECFYGINNDLYKKNNKIIDDILNDLKKSNEKINNHSKTLSNFNYKTIDKILYETNILKVNLNEIDIIKSKYLITNSKQSIDDKISNQESNSNRYKFFYNYANHYLKEIDKLKSKYFDKYANDTLDNRINCKKSIAISFDDKTKTYFEYIQNNLDNKEIIKLIGYLLKKPTINNYYCELINQDNDPYRIIFNKFKNKISVHVREITTNVTEISKLKEIEHLKEINELAFEINQLNNFNNQLNKRVYLNNLLYENTIRINKKYIWMGLAMLCLYTPGTNFLLPFLHKIIKKDIVYRY
jgi:hypothetical protein